MKFLRRLNPRKFHPAWIAIPVTGALMVALSLMLTEKKLEAKGEASNAKHAATRTHAAPPSNPPDSTQERKP